MLSFLSPHRGGVYIYLFTRGVILDFQHKSLDIRGILLFCRLSFFLIAELAFLVLKGSYLTTDS